MVRGLIRILILSLLSPLIPSFLYAQAPSSGAGAMPLPIWPGEKRVWVVAGKVGDLRGQPLLGASVQVDIGAGPRFIKTLTTDALGDFRTEYNLDVKLFTELPVRLQVEKEGFHQAHGFVDFRDSDKTWEIVVAMRPETDGADELSVKTLASALAPGLRASLESNSELKPARKDIQRAVELFLDEHDASRSLPLFDKVVTREPNCADCKTLMGLAWLEAGNYAGASRQFGEAATLVSQKGSTQQKVNSLLILAALENWKGDYAESAGFLMQAKNLDPKNPMVLLELGRTLIFQQNWQAAEEHLEKAIEAGASPEARVLRARALLEEGDPAAADAEMKKCLAGKSITSFPLSVRKLYAEIEMRMNLRTYAKVESVVSAPLPSLAKSFPELKGLEPAASPSDLSAILERTGESVQSFFRSFPNTVSVEQVREERLDRGGKMKDALNQTFQYLLLAQQEKSGLDLEEFRTNERGERVSMQGLDSGFMLSSGFASTSLLFHPAYQSGASFRYLGRQQVEGHTYHVVAFAQNPFRAQIYERFVTDTDNVVVLHQGLAWIDAENYRIVRLRTDLLKPQPAIRLQQQTTEIKYAPVEFKQVAVAMWLPSEVAVTLEWKGKTYRNFHRYSDYKVFNTETKERIHSASQPLAAPPGGSP